MKVKDIMTKDLTAVSETTTLEEVARILSRGRYAGLPVVDDEQRVIGFISEKDLIESAFPGQLGGAVDMIFIRNWAQTYVRLSQVGERQVKDFMTREPVCVTEGDTDVHLAELMVREKKKIVPVVREGRLVGIVSRADLCRVLMEKKEK